MNRNLGADLFTDLGTTWSDYDGDEIYGDFEMVGGSPVNKRSFEPGMARTENPLTTPVTDYYHGDMLGTTRMMSNPSGSSIEPAAYTAFGERISAPTITDASRYGYAGEWGYQAHGDFPFLHVGARYYDPASGRFLQRDPIGIEDGMNVYQYVASAPTILVDPDGDIWGNVARGAGTWVWRGGKWVWQKGVKPAANWGAKKASDAALSCVRWMNTGKLRFGPSFHKGKWRLSLRWKNKHWDVPWIEW